MILELSFLTGRYHATPWGRHVNEAVPEWPPAPFRIARALLDAWYRKHPSIERDSIEELLKMFAIPPKYWLPPARAAHTRAFLAQNKEDPTDRKLVFDGFAVLDAGATALLSWPGATLSDRATTAARILAGELNYLGRSETWIEARVCDDRDESWNCVPYEGGTVPEGNEVTPVAGLVAPDRFATLELPLMDVGKGQKKISRPLTWFEALGWGSSEAIEYAMNRPPSMDMILYLRRHDALDARLRPSHAGRRPTVEGVLYSVQGRVPLPLTHALELAERFRIRRLGIYRKLSGSASLSPSLSGKDASGRPLEARHAHLAILPLDRDWDGWVDHLLVIGTNELDQVERRTLDRLDWIWQRSGKPQLTLTPSRFGTRTELLEPAATVVSATPFAPTRFRHPHRDSDEDAWLRQHVDLECDRRGLPRPASVERLSRPLTRGRHPRWLDFRRARKDDAPRPAYGLRLMFESPVLTPFSLGYASHFGLGCFVKAP